ncbi:MAG: hypothetical protein ACQEVT_18640 [Pseudomonadota bacterium]
MVFSSASGKALGLRGRRRYGIFRRRVDVAEVLQDPRKKTFFLFLLSMQFGSFLESDALVFEPRFSRVTLCPKIEFLRLFQGCRSRVGCHGQEDACGSLFFLSGSRQPTHPSPQTISVFMEKIFPLQIPSALKLGENLTF